MASSTVVANLINREVENSDAWSLGCDITIEEMDVVVEEIKLNDIAIAGVIKTDDISVDIDHDKNNVMDLDVNVVIDGLNSSIVESQVVPYERIVETNELSPESSYEKGFAASAKSVKKVKDSVDSLDNTVKSNTSNIAKVATDIESLTRRVDRLSMSEGGEDLGGIWYIDELTGNLVTDKQVEIKSNLIVAGDTSTGRTGEDPGTTGIDEEQLQDYLDEHKYITSDYPYSKQEVDNKIEGIDVSGQINNALTDYAKTEDVNNALENKADKTELDKYLLKKAESQEIEGDITIKGNLIITGDTSTGGTGQDVPSGIDEAQLKEYLDTNKYITSDYAYSKEETASEISNAIAGIEIPSLEGYAKLTDIPSLDGYATEQFVTDSITALNVGQYATKTALETLQGEVDNIESVLGMDEEAEGIINTWNEVKAFLAEIEVGDDLASILEGINTRIGNNTTAIGLIDDRVTVNEAAISDNATNIKNLKDSVYTKDDLATYKAWWDDVMSLVVKDGNNIKINTNLIVTGDTASGARGTNSGTDGTLIGVVVNGTRYEDETNGMLDLSTLMNQYALATEIPSLDGYAKLTDIPTTMAWTAITGKPSFASVATSGSYNDLSNKPTIPTKTSQIAEETNLYFTNARAVSALADTLKDYVTKTALASDLGEYASKEWVNEKGYITGITLTGDDYISVNGYKLSLAIDAQGGLTNTGQGLGIYQIPSAKIVTDALGYTPLSTGGGTIQAANTRPLVINSTSSDKAVELRLQKNGVLKADIGHDDSHGVYIYDAISNRFMGINTDGTPYYYNGSYKKTLYHTGNFNPADYLPLSGGTISASASIPFVINSTSTYHTLMSFHRSSSEKARVGHTAGVGAHLTNMVGGGVLKITDAGALMFNDDTLIHSGNIGSQSVDKALRLRTGIGSDVPNIDTLSFTDWSIRWYSNIPSSSPNLPSHNGYQNGLLVFPLHSAGTTAQMYMTAGNYLGFRGATSGAWKQIAFTDSTVAAANKLVTSGGTDTVIVGTSSGIKVLYESSDFFRDSLGLVVQRENLPSDAASTGMALIARGGKGSLLYGGPNGFIVYHYDGANPTQHMTINSSGNVTIGGSDLAGTDYKLYVNGASEADSLYVNGYIRLVAGGIKARNGYDINWFDSSNHVHAGITGYNNELILRTNNTEALRIKANGNVLIGTTADSGYKLDVNGDISIAKGYSLRNGNHALIGRNSGDNVEINAGATARDSITTIYGTYIGFSPNRGATTALSIAPNGAVTMSSTLSITGAVTIGSTLSVGGAINDAGGFQAFLSGGSSSSHWQAFGSSSAANTSILEGGAGIVLKTASTDRVKVASGGDVTIAKNLIVGGDTSSGSDIRFKDRIADHRIALSDIADAPLFTFRWNDREDDSVHLGSSAQYWEKVAPWLVKGEDFKTLDYSTLGVAIGISLANKTINLEDRVKILENENKALKEQIRRIQYGS